MANPKLLEFLQLLDQVGEANAEEQVFGPQTPKYPVQKVGPYGTDIMSPRQRAGGLGFYEAAKEAQQVGARPMGELFDDIVEPTVKPAPASEAAPVKGMNRPRLSRMEFPAEGLAQSSRLAKLKAMAAMAAKLFAEVNPILGSIEMPVGPEGYQPSPWLGAKRRTY